MDSSVNIFPITRAISEANTWVKEINQHVQSRTPSPQYSSTQVEEASVVRVDSTECFPQFVKPAKLQNCELHPFQKNSLRWLSDRYRRGLGCMLADEMGLGKTVQSISFVSHVFDLHSKNALSSTPKFLIVCPLSVLDTWSREFQRFCPT